MDSISDIETKILEIREKFSKGLYVFAGSVRSKREIFNKLKEGHFDEVREFENIINNQLVLIDYFDNKAIPYLILDIKRLLYDFGLENDRQTNDFLQQMLESLFYALNAFEDYKNSVLGQQETLREGQGKMAADAGTWMEHEMVLIKKFFEKFDKTKIEAFNQYIREIGLEIEQEESGRIGRAETGAVFAKVIQARIAAGKGLKVFSREAKQIARILGFIAGIAGAIYITKFRLAEMQKTEA